MRALVASTFSVAVTAAMTCASAGAEISDTAAIASDPPYTKQTLVLTDIPEPSGPAISLFNGTDLSGWDKWIGYRDPALTYHQTTERAVGKNTSEGASTFRVVEEDGKPALYVEGELWGALVHKGVHGNYHLRMQYKWGSKKYPPRQDMPENNGLLYHSYGKLGSVFGTWMPAVEFEIMRGSVGMAVQVGQSTGIRSYIGHDADLKLYPYRRYQVDGALAEVAIPTYNVEAASDAEQPPGNGTHWTCMCWRIERSISSTACRCLRFIIWQSSIARRKCGLRSQKGTFSFNQKAQKPSSATSRLNRFPPSQRSR